MNLGDNGERDRFRRQRADVDADGAAQSVAQTLGRGTQFLSDSLAPRARAEQTDIARRAG